MVACTRYESKMGKKRLGEIFLYQLCALSCLKLQLPATSFSRAVTTHIGRGGRGAVWTVHPDFSNQTTSAI